MRQAPPVVGFRVCREPDLGGVAASRRVDWAPSRAHYLDHVGPIWLALPEGVRGEYRPGPAIPDVLARRWGVPHVGRSSPSGLELVASPNDVRDYDTDVIICAHGAGQAYDGRPSWRVVGNRIAAVVTTRIGAATMSGLVGAGVPVVDVGSVKLDGGFVARHGGGRRPGGGRRVAVTSHWPNPDPPEANGGFGWLAPHLPALWEEWGWDVAGHAHPGDPRKVADWWQQRGRPFLPTFDEVADWADILVVDNSSVLFEWAALDRPVVVYSPPWFRLHVTHPHNPRFWGGVPGPHVLHGADLPHAVAVADHPTWQARRAAVVAEVYGRLDGGAVARAVAVIVAVARSGTLPVSTSDRRSHMRHTLEHRTYLGRDGKATLNASKGIDLIGRAGDQIPWDDAVRFGLVDPVDPPADRTGIAPTVDGDVVTGPAYRDELAGLTVTELKARLRGLSLPVSGTKDELIARLNDAAGRPVSAATKGQ